MPALDELATYVAETSAPMPDGSSELRLRWGSLLALGGAAAATGAYRLTPRRKKRTRRREGTPAIDSRFRVK